VYDDAINRHIDEYMWHCCVMKSQDEAESSDELDAAAPLMRNAMPDIAMASAAVARVYVSQSDDDLEPTASLPFPDLDLGDGASHIVPGSGGGGATCMHR